MDDFRVPPAASFAFEQIVSKVCDAAKVDYNERPYVARELQNHLESFWRREIENGLSTDDAQQQALASFGRVEDVARNLRQPLWKRLLFFERYRAERFITFLCIGVAIGFFISIIDIVYNDSKIPNDPEDFGAIGFMLNPVFAITALFIVRWKPKTPNRLLRLLAWSRFIVSPLVATGLLAVLFAPIRGMRMMIHAGLEASPEEIFVFTCFVFLTPMGVLAAACYISELLGLPRRRMRMKSALRAKM